MKAIKWLVLLIFIGSIWLSLANAQNIKDWWILRSYTPSPEIEQLASDTGMSELGRRLFYVSTPELNNRTEFNNNCLFPERSIVLGCYASQEIYIFAVDNKQLEGVEEVTAAHEMLHAAYERLSSAEKERINELLDSTYKSFNDKRLNESVAEYREADPSSVPNELHSILGTEHRDLPQELEDYYSQYFNDRQKVVNISEEYEKVFESLEAKIESYDTKLADLKLEISSLEAALSSLSNYLDSEATRLDALLANNQISAYNKTVPKYNSSVNEYNEMIETYQAKVERHNSIVEKRNDIAVEQNQLVQSLDSKFQPIGN